MWSYENIIIIWVQEYLVIFRCSDINNLNIALVQILVETNVGKQLTFSYIFLEILCLPQNIPVQSTQDVWTINLLITPCCKINSDHTVDYVRMCQFLALEMQPVFAASCCLLACCCLLAAASCLLLLSAAASLMLAFLLLLSAAAAAAAAT